MQLCSHSAELAITVAVHPYFHSSCCNTEGLLPLLRVATRAATHQAGSQWGLQQLAFETASLLVQGDPVTSADLPTRGQSVQCSQEVKVPTNPSGLTEVPLLHGGDCTEHSICAPVLPCMIERECSAVSMLSCSSCRCVLARSS